MKALTVKQEKFIEQYLQTGNATESYRRCYSSTNMKPSTANRNAKFLLDDNKISTRIVALRQEMRQEASVTRESIARLLTEAMRLAKEQKQAGPFVAGALAMAKLYGLLVARKELGRPGDFDGLTDQQLRKHIQDQIAKLGLTGASGSSPPIRNPP